MAVPDPARLPRPGAHLRRRRATPHPWLKWGIFFGALAPLLMVLVRASRGELTANPIAEAENELGLTALIFLLASLAGTPAKRVFGWTWLIRARRELGLFAYFYAVLHFLTYAVLDQTLDWDAVVADILKRPFITIGFAALILITPLALTSTGGMVRRLGYRRWQRLHRLVYLAAGLAAIHFIWRVKLDLSQPLTYAFVLAGLFAVRVAYGRWPRPTPPRTRPLATRRPAEPATAPDRADRP